MEMLWCERVGSGGCMLPDRRWVCLERELGCGELLRGIGGRGRASFWGVVGQEMHRYWGGESSRLRFALVLCIIMCTFIYFYATRQTQRRTTRNLLSTPNKGPDHGGIPLWIGLFWRRTLCVYVHTQVKNLLKGVTKRFVFPGATLIEHQDFVRRHFPSWTTCTLYRRFKEWS